MESVLARGKEYEQITVELDPVYAEMSEAVELVREFIIANDLIVYGGTAIDFALRLHGDKIYPDSMLAVPDLDFFSPDAVGHAYKLADMLFRAGFEEVRAINALHTTTMKVDLRDNHYIADLSYVPAGLFARLPYVVYNGMRVIHPDYQRVDMHIALSFPYSNTPREAIFERWSKDIKRFAKMTAKYPLTGSADVSSDAFPWGDFKIPTKLGSGGVFCGLTAFALLLKYLGVENKVIIDVPDITSEGDMTLHAPKCLLTVAVVSIDPAKFVDGGCGGYLAGGSGARVAKYESLFNLLLERTVVSQKGLSNLVIFSTKGKLTSVNSLKISGRTFRIVNVQCLLWQFLGLYHCELMRSRADRAQFYIECYNVLLGLVSADKVDPVLLPSIVTYGSDNVNMAREMALNRLQSDIDNVQLIAAPMNYYPDRGQPPPVFDYTSSKFFRMTGREIPNDIKK